MTLFKERQASAKKIIQLENEIISLKLQAANFNNSCSSCLKKETALKTLEEEISSLSDDYEMKLLELSEELSSLKTDLKKTRSEATKLKNKLSSFESEEK